MVVSALGYAGIISLGQFVFFKPFVFTLKAFPQVWRLVTAFFITKPKFAIVLDPYFCTHGPHLCYPVEANDIQCISTAAV